MYNIFRKTLPGRHHLGNPGVGEVHLSSVYLTMLSVTQSVRRGIDRDHLPGGTGSNHENAARTVGAPTERKPVKPRPTISVRTRQ
jgi:hypothetical protein